MQDLHSRWPHRWLSPKAEARESSIEGLGVFAVDHVKAGEPVGVLGGVIVPKSEINDYRNIMTQVGIQIDEEFFIVPTTREELKAKGVFNHSCDPNIGFSNSITFVAIRDIEPGEEFVFDYAFCETAYDGFECRCGSSRCRGTITSDDWKIAELQERYGKFFSPYLRERI